MKPKKDRDPSAVALGSKGGNANTPTQNKARAANAAKARAAKLKIKFPDKPKDGAVHVHLDEGGIEHGFIYRVVAPPISYTKVIKPQGVSKAKGVRS